MKHRSAYFQQAADSAVESGGRPSVIAGRQELDGEAWVKAYLANPTSETKDQAVRAFLPLVKHIIKRIHLPQTGALQMEDMYHSGILGLLDALERYQAGHHTTFKTFAYLRIQGEIIDAVRKTGVLTRSQSKQVRILLDTQESLSNELGREPTHAEVQEKMGLTARDYESIRMLIWQQQSVSLDDEIFKDETETVVRKDLVVDEDQLSPEEEFIAMGLKEELKQLIARLPERNRLILALYYYEELTLIDIGRVLGVSESRISQLLKETLGELKKNLAPTRK
ncbi:MAG: FliA/WhiG family RNA polymerase sigma factor [Candidatus Marinimicrobia bacterium]|nr:FliA/WhiG family RNA polymerase sigma factor [Candidatus Neomarinimicrobiota bacterium]MCF7841139.1 FliA/WhiG family RNA polymerase sigma factor [Candidatus Neomarinimicrobiota bacterium]MCF7902399.1 FliA/WhiG family RNA polymerase sigma factor [Candidatus Neomarinimicrobiota bacterium]